MNKKILKCLTSVLLLGCTFTMASCNNPASSSTGNSSTSESTETSKSESSSTLESIESSLESSSDAVTEVIKSLTAKNEVVNAKIGETLNVTQLYNLVGYKSLSAAQKVCTYASDNEKVVKFNSKTLRAVGVGEANITVTSKVDTTKTCSFKVVVKDIYFNRETSGVNSDDDFDNELIEDGGEVRTKSLMSGDYFVNGIDSTKFMMETEIVIHSVASNEKYPKFGIVVDTMSNAGEGVSNRLYYFLDAAIGNSNNTSWSNFGVCEVFNGSGWAWNAGIGNEVARHQDALYTLPEGNITYETVFKMKLVRNGLAFHLWANDVYAGSVEVLSYLFSDAQGNPATSQVGLFQFQSDATFKNYSATQDEAAVDAAIASIENVTFLTNWADD